jgi:dihydrofolate reductase
VGVAAALTMPMNEEVLSMGSVVLDMSMSLDGFALGPSPRVGVPLGEGGQRLHDWMFSGPSDPGKAEGGQAAEFNGEVARELFATTGAVLMGRRMFDLGIGPWADTPFPVPCFVLTHHQHEDLVMTSGTFTFTTEGLTTALERAKAAAGSKNVLAHSPASPGNYCSRACSTKPSCTWCRSCSAKAGACSSTPAKPATSSS